MNVVSVSDLPAGEGSRSRGLEGAGAGGVDLSIIDLDPDRGPRPHRHAYPEVSVMPLRQLSLHLAPAMVTEWLEGER